MFAFLTSVTAIAGGLFLFFVVSQLPGAGAAPVIVGGILAVISVGGAVGATGDLLFG